MRPESITAWAAVGSTYMFHSATSLSGGPPKRDVAGHEQRSTHHVDRLEPLGEVRIAAERIGQVRQRAEGQDAQPVHRVGGLA